MTEAACACDATRTHMLYSVHAMAAFAAQTVQESVLAFCSGLIFREGCYALFLQPGCVQNCCYIA
jgi:hypothetical protein